MQKDDDLIREILDFWFSDEVRPLWFNSTPEFDQRLRNRYEDVWGLARADSYDHWEQEPEGALALVIILCGIALTRYRVDLRS